MAFSIVGIGASVGGLEAVTELLGALPARAGMAYIVVQHLDPRHESLLSEILAKKTGMPASEARAGDVVQPDHVYVIPPDTTLTVVDGRINLAPRPTSPDRPLPVDALFRSLAAAYGDSAIGVVLSGGDSDGSLGVRIIKLAGGMTFAQTPESARCPDMPRYAIETGCVDLVLRPQQIAKELAHFSRRPSFSERPADSAANMLDAGTESDDVPLRNIFQRLRSAHDVDFTRYKRTTIHRRLHRRMTLRRTESLREYESLLESDPGELAALYQDLLIRVTEFFREPDSFEALRRYVFPAICEGRAARQPIRIWVPGCATGEEAYSIAIALLEYLVELPPAGVQIFGTDVSDAALQTARAGTYPANVLSTVSAERLERFFSKQDGEYRIAKALRDLCLFARHDLTSDPPFSRLDLIICRNVLIYLDRTAQQRALRTFHYALRPGGMLMFGPAESAGQSSELFEQADKRFRVYRRLLSAGNGFAAVRRLSDSTAHDVEDNDAPVDSEEQSLPRAADQLLLARFAPASLLVNQALTILQFRGQTGPYLEPAGGLPSFDLRHVVRPELLIHIVPALQETSKSGAPSSCVVQLLEDGRDVTIEILPLTGPRRDRAFLILFDDGSRLPSIRGLAASVATLPESEKDRRLLALGREVEALRAYMRAAIEDHGAIQEELKSAHEEVLSANEEFQTTNEELESSKEELQSANEELTTTIDELRARNQQLAALNAELDRTRLVSERARSYADTIIETVRVPLAVLDGAQRILRINPAFSSNLEVAREDAEGHFLHEIDGGRWNIPELRQKLGDVANDAQRMDDWEATIELPRQGRRVMALTARRIPGDAERAELLLLAFDDVTTRSSAMDLLVANNERKDDFLAMLGHELRHPLTPIVHAIYLLRLGDPDAAAADLLDTIDTEAQRLMRFVDELLDVARISRGLIEIRSERVDLIAVVRDATKAVQPFVANRRHTLSITLPETPIYVKGDSGRLNQVVTNLLENAVKYTDPGGQIGLTLEQR